MKTNVYIDGFNLYYGLRNHGSCKWLDLAALCRLALPKNEINRIRYFTAPVQSSSWDPDKATRQEMYLRALRTIPNLTIHKGLFLSHNVFMPLAHPQPGGPYQAEVAKTEEKGSDVNLATYLLLDCFKSEYEAAVVVSNDSDLVEPISVVRREFGLTVGVLNPHERPARDLLRVASFYKPLRKGLLQACQFPPTLVDAHGEITKPKGW